MEKSQCLFVIMGVLVDMRFKDRVIWITGASSGIGEALAYRFYREGAKLILSSNEEGELNRVKSNCGNIAKNIFILPLDLTEIDTLETKAVDVLKHYGHIDILLDLLSFDGLRTNVNRLFRYSHFLLLVQHHPI